VRQRRFIWGFSPNKKTTRQDNQAFTPHGLI
jgi:hypothetical protein